MSTSHSTPAADAVKTCSKCDEVKPLAEFGRRGDGLSSQCKPCRAARLRDYAARNPERIRDLHRRYRERYPERRRQQVRASIARAWSEWIDRLKSREAEFWALTTRNANGCLIWQGKVTTTGYGAFPIGSIRVKAHRAAFALAVGDPGDLMVCHKCDTPLCCNPGCLFLGAAKDNSEDASRKGRMHPGERTAGAIGTAELVAAMRLDYASGMSFQAVGDKYGFTYGGARSAVIGQTWPHIPGAVPPRRAADTRWLPKGRKRKDSTP